MVEAAAGAPVLDEAVPDAAITGDAVRIGVPQELKFHGDEAAGAAFQGGDEPAGWTAGTS